MGRHLSHMEEWQFWVIFGFGFGIVGFFWGFTRFRRKRRIENIPTSTVRGMALGIVELVGQARKFALFETPLSKKVCVFYKYIVERLEGGDIEDPDRS